MVYNPATYCWEGNDNDLCAFDTVTSSPSASSQPHNLSTPRPALITNASASQGVKIVGGMVFDPHRMCWLKVASEPNQDDDFMDGFNALDDEEDVFKDVPDLVDSPSKDGEEGGLSNDNWPVGEEFDVGPEFIRRQRDEEEKWRQRVGPWVRPERDVLTSESWRWDIRDIVNQIDAAQ